VGSVAEVAEGIAWGRVTDGAILGLTSQTTSRLIAREMRAFRARMKITCCRVICHLLVKRR